MKLLPRGKIGGTQIPCSADDWINGSLPLRLSLRWRRSEGTPYICRRLVDSRVRYPVGTVWVAVMAELRNKVVGVSTHLEEAMCGGTEELPALWALGVCGSVEPVFLWPSNL